MRIIGLTAFGGPEVLRPLTIDQPSPKPGEVRIRTHSVTVNPTDLSFREGRFAAQQLGDRPAPYIPGMDLAGVIDELGENTDGRLSVGDRVVALVRPAGPYGGAYADYVIAPQASVVAAPKGVDFPAASTLLLNGLTAQLALDAAGVPAGGWIGVTGAAGALGAYAVQLARHRGLQVIADAGPADRSLVESFGPHEIVDRGPDVAKHIKDLHPDGVPALIDGSNQTNTVTSAVAPNGVLVSVKLWPGPASNGVHVHPVNVADGITDTARLQQLVSLAEEGTLTLRVADVLPADQAAEAHRRLAQGGIRGRLVLDFFESGDGRTD
jgi:NADPH2:quinone reductase